MKLKVEIIYRIDGYDRRRNGEIKKALYKELGCGMATIYSYLHQNKENGNLTKLAALRLIAGKLNLSVDYLVE